MRKVTLVLALAGLVALIAMPAFAEVQNVKVGGELGVRAFLRDNYDLKKSETAASGNNDLFMMSTVKVDVDADLTDNVSTKVSLVNQRDLETVTSSTSESRINVNEAYVTLKEMLYSPLTLKIGRQPLWYGKGFIIGSTILAGAGARDPESSITAQEYTAFTGFDAISARLDYEPWGIDLLWAKIDENNTYTHDDIDLYGVNVGYKFASYDAEAEAYLFEKNDSSNTTTAGDSNTTDTIGIRGSLVPIADLNVWGELAYQLGDYVNQFNKFDRSALAIDLGVDYTLVNWTWVPKFGLEYVFYQGDAGETSSTSLAGLETHSTGDYEAWDPMYRGRFFTGIRDFQGGGNIYNPIDPRDQGSFKNQHAIYLTASVKPWEPVVIDALYGYFLADEEYVKGRDEQIGHEIDLRATYAYTEDVSFNLLAAIFLAGDYFDGETVTASKSDDSASQIVGSMKVAF